MLLLREFFGILDQKTPNGKTLTFVKMIEAAVGDLCDIKKQDTMTKQMNTLLTLEEAGQFVLSIFLFAQLDYAWWVFPACLFVPDISMFAYAINPKVGAFWYNLFHHKLIAVIVLGAGFVFQLPLLSLTGIILFGHAALDRIFGYGLKYNDAFKHTHLGWIGKVK